MARYQSQKVLQVTRRREAAVIREARALVREAFPNPEEPGYLDGVTFRALERLAKAVRALDATPCP